MNGDVPAGNDFIAIAAGGLHSLALKSDGSIVGWGHNSYGQLDIPAGSDFIAIDAGQYHSLALKADGSIVGWGSDGDGRLNIPLGKGFLAIAAGVYHSGAIRSVVPEPGALLLAAIAAAGFFVRRHTRRHISAN